MIDHFYQSHEGTTVRLACPWLHHQGYIPPPTITFHTERGPLVFTYLGDDND